MNDRQRDLFGFVGAAFAVMVALFILQEIVRTAGDARFHARISEDGRHPDTLAARERDAQKLQSGKMPIEAAMQEVASKGRSAFPSIVPKASEDVSALSGWVHRRGFTPYVPPPPPAPPPEEAVPGVEGEAAVQEAAAVQGDAAQPAGAPAPARAGAEAAAPAPQEAKPAPAVKPAPAKPAVAKPAATKPAPANAAVTKPTTKPAQETAVKPAQEKKK